MKIVWVPPEYGDAVACISADGIMSLWEEVAEGIVDWFFVRVESVCFLWQAFNGLSFGTELRTKY